MTNAEIITKYLKEFHEVQKMTVPIELESYLHRMLDEARKDDQQWRKLFPSQRKPL